MVTAEPVLWDKSMEFVSLRGTDCPVFIPCDKGGLVQMKKQRPRGP